MSAIPHFMVMIALDQFKFALALFSAVFLGYVFRHIHGSTTRYLNALALGILLEFFVYRAGEQFSYNLFVEQKF
jgi:ABC-type uncharacterized transport system permease subunit